MTQRRGRSDRSVGVGPASLGPVSLGPVSVGVVIPTYDRPQAVIRAVRSVIRQPGIAEVVVVDDASPSPVDLGTLPSGGATRLRLLRNAANRGVCAARNRGTEAAQATHLIYLDDDDTLLPWAGWLMRRWIARAPGHVVVGGVLVHRPGRRPALRRPPSSRPGEIWGLDAHLTATGRSINTKQAAAVPKALVAQAGGWDEALRSRSSSEFFYRLTAIAPVAGHGVPVYRLNRGDHAKLTADPALRRDSHRHISDKHRALLADPARRAVFERTHDTMMARSAATPDPGSTA